MPPVIVPSAAMLTLRWNYAGVSGANVLGAIVLPTTTINQALANTLDSAIKSAFTTNLAAQMHTAVQLLSAGIRDLRTPNMAEFIGANALVPGTAVGDPLPRASSTCVTLRTAASGQSFRGRVYIGGFTEAANAGDGTIATTANTAALNFVTAIGTAMSGNGLTFAVLSRPAERVQIVTTTFHADGTTDVETQARAARTGVATAVTAIVIRNTIWDSQRRRSGAGSSSTLMSPLLQNFVTEPN